MLANDAYWLTHHDFTGERRTSKHAAGVMIATATLAELIEAGAAGISHGHLVALTPAPPLDDLGADVVQQITIEGRRHTAAQWLEYLSSGMCERIGRRMVEAGVARSHRIGLRRPVVIANDGDHGPAWVYAGLIRAVQEGLLMDERQCFLLRLARYSSVGHQLLSGFSAEQVDVALAQTTRMRRPWRELLDTAVGAIRSAAVTR